MNKSFVTFLADANTDEPVTRCSRNNPVRQLTSNADINSLPKIVQGVPTIITQ